jgi:hypothetical protein
MKIHINSNTCKNNLKITLTKIKLIKAKCLEDMFLIK